MKGASTHNKSFIKWFQQVEWLLQGLEIEQKKPVNSAFFYYSRSRGGDNARKLLRDFKGYLIIESIPLDTKGKEIPGSGPLEIFFRLRYNLIAYKYGRRKRIHMRRCNSQDYETRYTLFIQ